MAALSVRAPSGSNSSPVGPIGPGNDHRSRGGVGDLAGHLGGPLGQLVHPTLGPVQLETMTIAAERVGQDDVGAGVDELLVQRAHLVGMVDVPELGRVAGTEAPFEVVRACRAVGKQGAPGGQQVNE